MSFIEGSIYLVLCITHCSGGERDVVETGERELFEESPYKSCTLESGVPVYWYQRLEDVPLSRSNV